MLGSLFADVPRILSVAHPKGQCYTPSSPAANAARTKGAVPLEGHGSSWDGIPWVSHSTLMMVIWGFPARHGGTPMAGLCWGKSY